MVRFGRNIIPLDLAVKKNTKSPWRDRGLGHILESKGISRQDQGNNFQQKKLGH